MSRNMMLILAAVVLLAGFGAFIFMSSRNQTTPAPETQDQTTPTTTETLTPETTSSTESATAQEATKITYTDSGFIPKSLTVKLGDTVTFVNNSSKQMWIASAPHPTHTNYPGFDAKKGYSVGESYSFTFDKVGSWNYHDHLNPANFGTIVVE